MTTPAGRAGLLRALERVGLIALPLVMLTATVAVAAESGDLAIDFRTVTPEIKSLLHGTSPYVVEELAEGGHFLWTVAAGWLLAPLAWLPGGWAVVMALELVGIVTAIRLLGVTDWRPIALALAWPATVNSFQTGNITVLVLVLLAASWADSRRAGLWVGAAVAVKLFAWPALVCLAATRRWRQLGYAAAVVVAMLLVQLPYTSLRDFVEIQAEVGRVFATDALTLTAALHDQGVPLGVARTVTLAVGLIVLALGRRDLGWCVVAMLVLSPVVWLHYLDLLVVPLALWRAPLWAWCLPFLFFLTPGEGNGEEWQTVATLAVMVLTVAAARLAGRGPVARQRPGRASPAPTV